MNACGGSLGIALLGDTYKNMASTYISSTKAIIATAMKMALIVFLFAYKHVSRSLSSFSHCGRSLLFNDCSGLVVSSLFVLSSSYFSL